MRVKGLGVMKQVNKKLVVDFKIINIGLINFYFSMKINKNCIKKFFKLF